MENRRHFRTKNDVQIEWLRILSLVTSFCTMREDMHANEAIPERPKTLLQTRQRHMAIHDMQPSVAAAPMRKVSPWTVAAPAALMSPGD